MTYREKAIKLIQQNMGIKKEEDAKIIIDLIIKDNYSPKIFGKLNAPKNLEDWDTKIPETREDYINIYNKMFNSICEKTPNSIIINVNNKATEEYFGDRKSILITPVDACAYYIANYPDMINDDHYEELKEIIFNDDRLLDYSPQPPYHNLYDIQYAALDLIKDVISLELEMKEAEDKDNLNIEEENGYDI